MLSLVNKNLHYRQISNKIEHSIYCTEERGTIGKLSTVNLSVLSYKCSTFERENSYRMIPNCSKITIYSIILTVM